MRSAVSSSDISLNLYLSAFLSLCLSTLLAVSPSAFISVSFCLSFSPESTLDLILSG